MYSTRHNLFVFTIVCTFGKLSPCFIVPVHVETIQLLTMSKHRKLMQSVYLKVHKILKNYSMLHLHIYNILLLFIAPSTSNNFPLGS